MRIVLIVLALGALLLLWGVARYRKWKYVVTGASGRSYTVFRAHRQPGTGNRFELVYSAEGMSLEERNVAETELLIWATDLAQAHRCDRIEICAASRVQEGRILRRYYSECTEFIRQADGSWGRDRMQSSPPPDAS